MKIPIYSGDDQPQHKTTSAAFEVPADASAAMGTPMSPLLRQSLAPADVPSGLGGRPRRKDPGTRGHKGAVAPADGGFR